MHRTRCGAITVALLAAGCAAIVGLEQHDQLAASPSEDGGVADDAPLFSEAGCPADLANDSNNCGRCGRVCDTNSYCKAGQCVLGCHDRIIYVSTKGNDANPGCRLDAPKRTIAAAIALARGTAAEGHAIHVCGGSYDEPFLTLDYPV